MLGRALVVRMIATVVLLAGGVAGDAEAGARRSRPLETGQVACWDFLGRVMVCAGSGQDGDLLRGETRAYVDRGDGSIKDQRTALMWEKQSDDGSIHDKDNGYDWAEAFQKIDVLNTTPCFAGFCDWRLPNIIELQSLVKFGTVDPAVPVAFNSDCGGAHSSGNPGCTVTTCSCTVPGSYWSSTTHQLYREEAWSVYFSDGVVSAETKAVFKYHVRAVRGGS